MSDNKILSVTQKYPALSLSVIYELKKLVDTNDKKALFDLGVSEDLAKSIINLSISDVEILCENSEGVFYLAFNLESLQENINKIKELNETRDCINRLITNDAPREMIKRHFNISGAEYNRIREKLGLPQVSRGRWPIPSIEDINFLIPEFSDYYRSNIDLLDNPDLCLMLSDKNEITIRQLLALWKKFKDNGE